MEGYTDDRLIEELVVEIDLSKVSLNRRIEQLAEREIRQKLSPPNWPNALEAFEKKETCWRQHYNELSGKPEQKQRHESPVLSGKLQFTSKPDVTFAYSNSGDVILAAILAVNFFGTESFTAKFLFYRLTLVITPPSRVVAWSGPIGKMHSKPQPGVRKRSRKIPLPRFDPFAAVRVPS
jgi:hypothetical protein